MDHFADHDGYIEPFGGAASILVNKPRSELEVYNDLNSDCVNFFKAVKHHANELAEWTDATPYSRELFEEYVESYPDWPDDPVEHGGRFLFVQSANFGGKLIGQETPTFKVTKPDNSRLDAGGMNVYPRKTGEIHRLKDRFKGVVIESLDYAEIIDKYDRDGALFYMDPPYVNVGDGYYQVEDGAFDHQRFVEKVKEIDSKWVISYDENIPEELSSYYTVDRSKKTTMNHGNDIDKTESLVMNYDPNKVPLWKPNQQQGLEQYE